MPRVLSLSEAGLGEGLEAIRAVLRADGVLGIPTDTLYGLAVDPFSEKAVSRVFDLKGRDQSKALPVLVADLDSLTRLGAELDPRLLARLRDVWPAPLTVVVPVRAPFAATGGAVTVAARVPDHAGLRAILSAVGPVTATSANRSGRPAARSAAEVAQTFGDEIELLVDGGPSGSARASTLVDGTVWPPRILREGSFVFLAND